MMEKQKKTNPINKEKDPSAVGLFIKKKDPPARYY